MNDAQDPIGQLQVKLDQLIEKQAGFSLEIDQLRQEITQLKTLSTNDKAVSPKPIAPRPAVKSTTHREESVADFAKQFLPEEPPVSEPTPRQPLIQPQVKANIEKFIGENLINKIGIAITVIGVAIGAKYSIENDLISPLTRIILGYLAGVGLLLVGMRLKQKYVHYSAVLVSGAIAIMYFITYAAYDFYQLIPQVLAFGLMVIFTGFTD